MICVEYEIYIRVSQYKNKYSKNIKDIKILTRVSKQVSKAFNKSGYKSLKTCFVNFKKFIFQICLITLKNNSKLSYISYYPTS